MNLDNYFFAIQLKITAPSHKATKQIFNSSLCVLAALCEDKK